MFELICICGSIASCYILYYLLDPEINKNITNNKSN